MKTVSSYCWRSIQIKVCLVHNINLSIADLLQPLIVPVDGFHVDIYSNSTPYIVLPTTTADCICPIIVINTCYNFSSCACFDDTPFSHSIVACRNGTQYQLTFSNLNAQINDTIVHLFESRRYCDDIGMDKPPVYKLYRKYFMSFRIIIGTNQIIFL